MIKYALFARLIAKPGKEQALADFLQAGLDGPIAKALMANAAELLASPPEIAPIEVLGMKNTLAS